MTLSTGRDEFLPLLQESPEAVAAAANPEYELASRHALAGGDGASAAYPTACRVRDVVLSGLALVVLSPLFGVLAILIKLDSPGPVIFAQRRGGRFGLPFLCFKFRTMTVLEDGMDVVQARKNDQRVTRIGRFLRKSSLDELPQLVNVFKGEMSLVGPRPHALAHDEFYRRRIAGYMRRYDVHPGITGLAQISGCRGECETVGMMRRRVELDLEYAASKSFFEDLKILLKTPVRLVTCNKAY